MADTQPLAPTDAELLSLNEGEVYFSESPSKYPEAGHGTQYHAGAPGVLAFAREVLAKWGAQPVPAGYALVPVEPTPEMLSVMWVPANSSLADAYSSLSDAYNAMLAAAPQPVAREPLTDEQIQEAVTKAVRERKLSWLGFKKDDHGEYTIPVLSPSDYQMARSIERAHGITGAKT